MLYVIGVRHSNTEEFTMKSMRQSVSKFVASIATFGLLANSVALAGFKDLTIFLAGAVDGSNHPGDQTSKRPEPGAKGEGWKRDPSLRGVWKKRNFDRHEMRIEYLNQKRQLERMAIAGHEVDLGDVLAVLQSGGGTGGGGGSTPWEGTAGGVNTNTGNIPTYVPITSWPTKGDMAVNVGLIHNSVGPLTLTEFGQRWKSTYDLFLHLYEDEIVVEYPDGLIVPYARSGNTATTPAGFTDDLTYNSTTELWELKSKDQTKYNFTTTGFDDWLALARVTDRYGNYVEVIREDGNITQIIDGADTNRKVDFDLYASPQKFIDSGRGVNWPLTKASGNLTQVTYPSVGGSSPTRKFQYNSNHQITEDEDRRGYKTEYTYYPVAGNAWDDHAIHKIKNARLKETTFTYPSADETQITNANGQTIKHVYSGGSLVYEYDEQNFYTHYETRDSNKNPTKIKDKLSKIWEYTYDSKSNLLTVENPLNIVTDTYTYNSTNDLLTHKNAENKTWTYTYYGTGTPAPGSLKEVTDPLTRPYPVAKFTRNSAGDITEFYDGENLKSELTYNSRGDLTSAKTPDGVTTTLNYGSGSTYTANRGNVLYQTTGAGVTTSYVYDNWLRPISMYVGDNPSTGTYEGDDSHFTYNAENAATLVEDALGKQTTYAYNEINQLTSITNANGETESVTRDNIGQITAVTNARGKTRTYSYSTRGELTSLRAAGLPAMANPTEQHSYDARGLVSAYTNGLDEVINYTYDDAGRLTLVNYPTGTDTSFTYDSRDRRATMVDNSGTTTWTFNDANEVTQVAQPNGTISYEYRHNGQPKKRTEPNSVTVTYGYDSYGRLNSLVRGDTNWNDTTSIAYDSYGRPVTKTLGNGIKEHFEYDSLSRLNKVMVKNNAGTVTHRSQNWVYNGVGSMTSRTIDSVTTTYSYDNIHQLISESKSGSLLEYTYDANGNRLMKKLNGVNQYPHTLEYHDDDRIKKNAHGTVTYDDAGRPTVYPTSATTNHYFTWDYDDQMTKYSATSGGTAVEEYKYNGFGARVQAVAGSATRNDLRDGVSVTSPVVRSSGSGSTTTDYLPGVGERRGSTVSYGHSGLKNNDTQTNSSAAVSATREYDAWGNVLASTGSFAGPFGHAGDFGYQADGSGLQLLGHRYYDPEVGRFITRDPAKDGRNWFVYCENNPLVRLDPNGLDWLDSTSNYFAGWGDALTPVGAVPAMLGQSSCTQTARRLLGVDDVVDTDSGAYGAGQVTGTVHSMLLPVPSAVKARVITKIDGAIPIPPPGTSGAVIGQKQLRVNRVGKLTGFETFKVGWGTAGGFVKNFGWIVKQCFTKDFILDIGPLHGKPVSGPWYKMERAVVRFLTGAKF